MTNTAELFDLLDALREGDLGVDGERRLAEMLRASPEVRRVYCDYTRLVARLGRLHRVEPAVADVVMPRARRRYARFVWAGGAAAAGVLVAVMLLNRPQPTADIAVSHATLDRAAGAALLNRGAELRPGDPLPPGAVELGEGVVRLSWASGTAVVVEGPATFQVTGPYSVKVSTGRVTAHVPESGGRFRVVTRAATVAGADAEFGVDVVGDSATVEALAGKVDVTAALAAAAVPLAAGETRRFPAGAAPSDVAPADDDATVFVRFVPATGGVLATGGPLRFLPVPPASLEHGTLVDDAQAVLVPERRGVVLAYDLDVRSPDGSPTILRAGTRLDSFLVHYDPRGTPDRRGGGKRHCLVRFEQPVLGVVTSPGRLKESDALVGNEGTSYPAVRPNPDDWAVRPGVRTAQTLRLNFARLVFRQLRILVAAKAD